MLPKINQLVNISLDNEKNFIYKARIADVTPNSISIEIPMDQNTGRFKLLEVGTELSIFYLSNDEGQFTFATKTIGYIKEPLPLIMVDIPQKINRIQRRDYLRVAVSLETAFKIKDSPTNKWYHSKTVDISGGGFQFIQNEKIKAGQIIEGWLILPFKNGTIEHIKYQGEILRIYSLERNKNINYVSVKFTSIPEVKRGIIVRFCYEKQMETRLNKLNG